MRSTRDIASKLAAAGLCCAAGLYLLHERGGLTGASVPAYVEAIEHAVAPTVTGRIEAVKVALGDAVKEGDLLVALDDRAVKLEREHAENQLTQLEAELAAQLAIAKGQVLDNLLRSSSALADEQAARAELATLKGELERVQRLRGDQLIDAATFTQAERSYLAAQARVQVFERRRQQAPDLYAQKPSGQLDAVTEARVAPFRAAINVKRAELAQLDHTLAQYGLRAPVDGTVSVLAHPRGDVVAPGVEVLRLVRSRPGHLTVTVPEERAANLRPGLTLTVRATRGLWSERHSGRVVEVGPAVEQLPVRSWLSPQWPRWGRRATLVVEGATAWRAGERLYVQF